MTHTGYMESILHLKPQSVCDTVFIIEEVFINVKYEEHLFTTESVSEKILDFRTIVVRPHGTKH